MNIIIKILIAMLSTPLVVFGLYLASIGHINTALICTTIGCLLGVLGYAIALIYYDKKQEKKVK